MKYDVVIAILCGNDNDNDDDEVTMKASTSICDTVRTIMDGTKITNISNRRVE
jgi:hypothetical protein